jgi:hypothetical protein
MVTMSADSDSHGTTVLSSDTGGAKTATTDEEGRWELRGVAADTPVVAEATADGYDTATSAEFQVRSGATKDDIEVRFTRPGSIQINVESPPPGLMIAVFEKRGESSREPRIEQFSGSVTTVDGLEPGSWTLRLNSVTGPGGAEVNFDPDEQLVEVVAGETRTADFRARR